MLDFLEIANSLENIAAIYSSRNDANNYYRKVIKSKIFPEKWSGKHLSLLIVDSAVSQSDYRKARVLRSEEC